MSLEDDQLEQHLRTFHPHAPQTLPEYAAPRSRRVMTVVVPLLAVLLLCAGVLLVRLPKRGITLPLLHNAVMAPESLAQWNALERAHRLDDALALSARESLPRTDTPNSALHTLAKD